MPVFNDYTIEADLPIAPSGKKLELFGVIGQSSEYGPYSFDNFKMEQMDDGHPYLTTYVIG